MQKSGAGSSVGDSVLKHALRHSRITARLGTRKRVAEFVSVPDTEQAFGGDGVSWGSSTTPAPTVVRRGTEQSRGTVTTSCY